MKIEKVKTAFKVADALIDRDHGIRLIKFKFLDEIFNEGGKKLEQEILKDSSGRIYLIVVDGVIKKIGGSQSKGGIKSTLLFYQGGMQGGPSIRTFGIHLLIRRELEQNKKVEIYMITSKKTKTLVKGLFSEDEAEVAAFKDMEDKCKKDYKETEGVYPPWNFQERGEAWAQDILRAHNKHGKKRKSLR
ncbi:MAG TPA: hypothetical protein VHD69_02265 [Candidatus Paceibacterota bacterium]|jgi:hypothetical protein|nr:hypothetical protein [Candidatus Paceibacterota bacterium]